MSRTHPRKLSTILSLYFSISVIILTGAVLFFTYRLSIQTINTEVEKSFEQKKDIVENIFELEAEHIENCLQSIKNNKKLLNELYSSQQPTAQKIFQKHIDKSLQYNVDVMLISTSNNDVWIDASSPIPDTKPIVNELVNTARSLLFSAKILHFSNKEGKMTGIFKAKKITLEDGKVIGILISGVILDNNTPLLNKIKSRTRSLATTLLYETNRIASTERIEKVINNEYLLKEGQMDELTSNSFVQYPSDGFLISKPYTINFYGKLSSLYITFKTDDIIIATVKNAYINTIIIISLISLVFLALSFVIIKKIIYPSIERIIGYTENVIDADSSGVTIEPGSIYELNIIGSAMEKMVTGIHEANSKLIASEAKYRRLTENSPDMIFRMTLPEGVYEYVSPASTAIFGYPPEAWYNHSTLIRDLIHPDFHEYFNEKWALLLKGEVPPYYEYKIQHKQEQEERWLHQRNVTIWDKNNKIIAIEGIVTDITELKKSENALQNSHRRFLTVLNSIDATIYVVDTDTHEILFMNKNMIESFGRDMTGEICWDVYKGESEQCEHCPIDQILDSDGKPKDVYIWQGKNPITQRWYINYDRAIEWIDGRIVKIQIATDITEFKCMEEELRQAHKMESIGTISGGIAHDFNNILGVIIGNAELAIKEIPNSTPAYKNIQQIEIASSRAKDIVKQLLSFSRKTDQAQKNIQILPIINESISLIRASTPTTVEIQLHADDVSGVIKADPTQVHQILINMCTNAAHAMDEKGGILKISLAEIDLNSMPRSSFQDVAPGKYVKLTIEDTGVGIDRTIVDKIFDPYFTTKAIGKGCGMGLAVVHGIIKNCNGNVSVDSTPGQGTVFTILFPSAGTVSSSEEEPLQSVLSGNEKILFVDDEEMLAQMGTEILEFFGYKVVYETNSLKALELIRNEPYRFDLVITDMTMPHLTGEQLSQKILDINPDMPIILCTGFSSKIDSEKALEMGIKCYIEKPIKSSRLAAAVREVLSDS